jgi:NitT/TauT family transport system ATP-binding protein
LSNAKIRLVGLNKLFHTRFQTIEAVRNVDMEFAAGDFVSIIGPSGCGKSTIIRMIDDLIKPTSGEIFIDGRRVSPHRRIPPEVIRKIGFIFQQPNMYPWMTVRENVMLPLRVFGLRDPEWARHADALIEMTGLREQRHAYPTELSGGSMQRAGVIRAMVHKPDILLMDEPFGALDEMTREQLNLELLDIWRATGKTIVFITHSVQEAVLLSNRVYVMGTNPGRVVDEIAVDLPRPRNLKLIVSDRFAGYCELLTGRIGQVELSQIK